MVKNDITLEIPYGTRDFLPQEAAEKRAVETELMELFTAWGYDEIVTPAIEFLDTLTIGNGQRIEPYMFKFFDHHNRTLALRYEMTTPIARVVGSRMKEALLPIKISYISNVYRYEQAQAGRQCEFYQAGVEFMGSATHAADAEVLALATEGLRRGGLKDFQICLGQVEFINGLMRQFELSEAEQQTIKHLLEKHDLVGLRQTVAGLALPPGSKALLSQLPLLHGGGEVLDKARRMVVNEQSRRALDDLAALYGLLQAYGVASYVQFDLGVIRDFSYYTGMVFEAYTPGLGFPLCGGGRYDRMLSDFGYACPATGFALGIERLLLALEREGLSRPTIRKDVYLAYAPGREEAAIEAAQERRQRGEVVELSPWAQDEREAARFQRDKGYRSLLYIR